MTKYFSLLGFVFGCFLVGLGIVCMLYPTKTMLTISLFAAFLVFIVGIGYVYYYFHSFGRLYWILIDGIVSIVLGFVLMVTLFFGGDFGENLLCIVLGFWSIFKGVVWILVALNLRYSTGFIPSLSVGIILSVLGLIFVVFPEILAFLLSVVIGLSLIIFGSVVFGFSFRRKI